MGLSRRLPFALTYALLMSLWAAQPGDAACCQFPRYCDRSAEDSCRARGGHYSPCAYCDVQAGLCKPGFEIPIGRETGESSPADVVPPSCKMTAFRAGPPAQIDITVQDAGSGLREVCAARTDNAAIVASELGGNSTSPVVITATKIDATKTSYVEIDAEDEAGNLVTCDPVLAEIVRGRGRTKQASYSALDSAEHFVTVENGEPGLDNLEVEVNGVDFHLPGLRAGEQRTLDVLRAMLPGDQNIVTLKSHGKPGSGASVVIWDGGAQ